MDKNTITGLLIGGLILGHVGLARADEDDHDHHHHDNGNHYGWYKDRDNDHDRDWDRDHDNDRDDHPNWGRYPSRNWDYFHNDWYGDHHNYGVGYDGGRENGQFERIREGIRDGRLTQSEVNELRSKEQALQSEIRNDRANGLSGSERADIQRDYNKLNKDINHELNDGERRY